MQAVPGDSTGHTAHFDTAMPILHGINAVAESLKAGADGVFIPQRRSAGLSGAAVKASAGAGAVAFVIPA